MALHEIPESLAHLGQGVGLRHGDLELPLGHEPDQLGEDRSVCGRLAALGLDLEFLDGLEVDDRIYAIGADLQLEREIDIPLPKVSMKASTRPAAATRTRSATPGP